jgi:uncharacterized membrane protein YqjE
MMVLLKGIAIMFGGLVLVTILALVIEELVNWALGD